MTISELQIQLDISSGNELEVLKQYAYNTSYGGYLFVDSYNGQCYLFDEHGHLDDISKVKSIDYGVFYDYIFPESIIIPNSVESIGRWAFGYCTSLKSIVISDSVKNIGDDAFYSCTSLESIIIPDSVESIGRWAFEDCTSLKSIIILDSVKHIGKWAFYNCTFLKEVIFKGRTTDQVKEMDNYPWGITDTSVIKYQMS